MPPGALKNAPKRRPVGRPKLYEVRLLVSMSTGMLSDIDAVIGKGETRLDLIRAAIEREVDRRCRARR